MTQREEILSTQGFIVLANVDPHPIGEVLRGGELEVEITSRATFEDFRRQSIAFTGDDPAEERFKEKRERYRFFHKAVVK